MKEGQYWSTEYDSPVSKTFYRQEAATASSKQVKIDITKCEIVRNEYGYYYLYLKGKEIKQLTFEEYLKYRYYVIRVIDRAEAD